jgi:ATP-dependent helicase/nuclease subunit B
MSATFAAAARQLLAEQRDELPDLSGITLLVPHHHVVPPFLAALRQQITAPVFVPPRLATLPALASASGLADSQTDSQRLVALHAFLGRIPWLAGTPLWALAQTLLQLLNDLDDARLAPPSAFGDFAAQVEHAARRAMNQPMEREARLVFDLWRAFHQGAPGSRAAYAIGLAAWREQVTGPVYSLGVSGLTRMEVEFVARCQETLGLVELPVGEPWPARRMLLETVWRPAAGDGPLRARALDHAARVPVSPLALGLLGAPDMESEAAAVAARIRAWLAEGRHRIAVIALDRLAARRLRAVLERDQILMQDETGWTFATATVSHVLDRWLALLRDGFYHRDLLDLLKSPFLFPDQPVTERLAAVAALEHRIARHDVVAGLDRFLALAVGEASHARGYLERLDRAARQFRQRSRQPLSDWLRALFAVLDELGASTAFADDQAGRQLLDLLHRLTAELAADRTPYTLSDWQTWLTLQLDRATFAADDIESPVRLTHLAAARLRDFDAVVLLGADAAHLPPRQTDDLLGEAVRLQLGLPGQAQRRDTLLSDLIDVLSRADQALITWQAWRGTEPNSRSPWLDRLAAFHALAYGDDLTVSVPVADGFDAPPPLAPLPARLTELPEHLSASAWQSLVSCPYQFFARYGLGLGETEAVAETMEKSEYGELVHDILRRFHEAHPVLSDRPRAELLASLEAIGAPLFEAREAGCYLAVAWRLRWQTHVPDYLDWALQREAEGWHWHAAETGFELDLPLADSRHIRLRGRADRVDRGPDGLAVLDYKTQSRSTLRARLKTPGEQTQLPFYGLLTNAARAGLVALDDDERVETIEQPGQLVDAVSEERARLTATLTAMAEGAALPAHGAPETCQWCEMRGLCRRA